MAAGYVTPFEFFKSCVEFYPKLGATIAFGTMAAAAKMMSTRRSSETDALQTKVPEIVPPTNISSPRKRNTPPKPIGARKTSRKAHKRATGRRKAAQSKDRKRVG